MGYLISEIIFCLLLSAVIGFVIGWLLRGLSMTETSSENNLQQKPTESKVYSSNEENDIPRPVTKTPSLSHQIEKIHSIDRKKIKRLHKVGIFTTKDLLKQCVSRNEIDAICQLLEINTDTLNHWLAISDLMRIPDINDKIAKLIIESGVKSAQALTKVDATALVEQIQKVNSDTSIFPDNNALPNKEKVDFFIYEANRF